MHKPARTNNDGHAETGAQQHQFTAATIRQSAPKRTDNRNYHKGDPKRNTGVDTELAFGKIAELVDIEWDKRRNLTKTHAGDEGAKPQDS